MTNEKGQKLLLLTASLGLVPVAFTYGILPEKTLTPLYGFAVDDANLTHILRAVMGIYLGQALLWFLGATKPALRTAAMYGLVFFMFGVASGRVISLIADGLTHWLFLVFLGLEIILGTVALKLILNEQK